MSDDRTYRDTMDAIDRELNWDDINDTQLDIIQRLGPTVRHVAEPFALILLGMTTLYRQGMNLGELIILASTIARRIDQQPEGIKLGRAVVEQMKKGRGDGN